jgi:hypothetical protein
MRTVKLAIPLSDSEASTIVDQCRKALILPDEWIRRAAGLASKEPFWVTPPPPGLRTETSRMLFVLEDLWKKSPEAFNKAATGIGGNSRLWFSTDPGEIRKSGNSNKCARIGESSWWVSTNCPWNGMTSRIEKIMCRMGFSDRYVSMVSGVIINGAGTLCVGDYIK